MKNIKRLQALVLLSVGVALSGYSLIAMNDFMSSARSILMMGSRYGTSGAVFDRIMAAAFLIFIAAVGVGLIVAGVKALLDSNKR